MEYFDFCDVQLIPKKCVVYSRLECDPSATLNNITFKLPVIPANMVSIINEKLAIEFAQKGYFYIMHRFNFDSFEFVKKCKKLKIVCSISVGVKDYDYDLITALQEASLEPDFITIDIAHGHSERTKNILAFIKKKLPNSFLIAGNIATTEAALDLEEWGADALKVGVGPGEVCITKLKTGFGTAGWQLSAVHAIRKVTKLPIIADGGLRHIGDIAKAIRFGADFCMIGYMLAAHKESPGNLVTLNNTLYKEYYGSASMLNKKTKVHIEGKKELLPLKGSLWKYLDGMHEDIRSAISYAGGRKLSDLCKVEYVIIK